MLFLVMGHWGLIVSRELSGLTAVVTGSSSGIGRAIALELALAGADVLLHARRNHKGLQDVAAKVDALGRQSKSLLYDLADPATHGELVAEAWNWRPIDIWINNAGADVLTGKAAGHGFDEKIEQLWWVDVRAAIRLSRMTGARMKDRGQGVLVNMGWDQASSGMGGDSGEMFAATKGAVMAFSRSLAKSLAPQVRVHCLAPGWIKTQWGQQASESWQARAENECLLARWGTPEDVAQVCRFLVSPAAAFVTGQIIYVNGGRP